MDERHKLWKSWDTALKDQVWSATSTPMRCEIREWMAEEAEGAFSQGCTPQSRPKARATLRRRQEKPSNPATPPLFIPRNIDEICHDWHVGARIGEAANPGPQSPQTRQNPNQARATQNAGELAKGTQPPAPPVPGDMKRRKPGMSAEAQQASTDSWPLRKQHHSAPNQKQRSGPVAPSSRPTG